MTESFNIYCDESCHLENDHCSVMVLGAVWCPENRTRDLAESLREIKTRHGLPKDFETKWTKVSPALERFYLALLDHFFDSKDLHFRALIVPDKSRLTHDAFGHDHDTWYYKMYFDMLKVILSPEADYRVYLDIKDTRSARKIEKLHEALCNNMYDFSRAIIKRVQTVRSHEVEQVQLADLLIGAIAYANRELSSSIAKVSIVKRIQERSGYCLRKTTLIRESKVNLFRWTAREPPE